MFLYKNQFLLIFSFLSIPIELWESTAAIFRQSTGYVIYVLPILYLRLLGVRKAGANWRQVQAASLQKTQDQETPLQKSHEEESTQGTS